MQTYLINNFGATTSLTNLLEDMEKAGIHIKRETLNRYITILKEAKILCECNRFDLKSRRSIAALPHKAPSPFAPWAKPSA